MSNAQDRLRRGNTMTFHDLIQSQIQSIKHCHTQIATKYGKGLAVIAKGTSAFDPVNLRTFSSKGPSSKQLYHGMTLGQKAPLGCEIVSLEDVLGKQ